MRVPTTGIIEYPFDLQEIRFRLVILLHGRVSQIANIFEKMFLLNATLFHVIPSRRRKMKKKHILKILKGEKSLLKGFLIIYILHIFM